MFNVVCASSIGMRPTQEDNFLVNTNILDDGIQKDMPSIKNVQYEFQCSQKVNIIGISDGMGGHNAGEVASRFCVQRLSLIQQQLQDCDSLQDVIDKVQSLIPSINSELCLESRKNPKLSGMGATLVMFLSYESECAILNIGDSRAYEYDGKDFIQLTKDHTEGQRMLDLGILTRKELIEFPARKNINRYFGQEASGYLLQADVFYPKDRNGIIMLCSDGVSDSISEHELITILSENEDISHVSKEIMNKVSSFPNGDNATVILIKPVINVEQEKNDKKGMFKWIKRLKL